MSIPRWKCHKQVWAFKINRIDPKLTHGKIASARLVDTDGNEAYVDEEYWVKHKPVLGGYYVKYDDGYESFSPAKAFEEGYTRL